MATTSITDGPGVYDAPYVGREAVEMVLQALPLQRTKAAKLRYIDSLIAVLQARRTRVDAGTETDVEKYGHQHTVLAGGDVTSFDNDPM